MQMAECHTIMQQTPMSFPRRVKRDYTLNVGCGDGGSSVEFDTSLRRRKSGVRGTSGPERDFGCRAHH